MSRIFANQYFNVIVIFCSIIFFELLFLAIATKYLPNQMSSWMISAWDFFLTLFQEEPLYTLQLVLIDKPIFVIGHTDVISDIYVWSLHFHSYTIVVHLIIAFLCARMIVICRENPCPNFLATIAGAILVLVASLYLQLASCCTGGPNWIVHTWLLSLLFNPISATVNMIKVYQLGKGLLPILQLLCAGYGGYLIYRHWPGKRIHP